jgi:hypothetical protein
MSELLRTLILVGYSIVMLWCVSWCACKHGRFLPYSPFFLWTLLYNALAAFVYYQMQLTFWWFLLDFAFFICYVLLLITIIRIAQKMP